MATLVHDLDLPTLDLLAVDDIESRQSLVESLREQSWLARSALGYAVLRYEDVVGILRERRFHQAASMIAELSGITDPEFLVAPEGVAAHRRGRRTRPPPEVGGTSVHTEGRRQAAPLHARGRRTSSSTPSPARAGPS